MKSKIFTDSTELSLMGVGKKALLVIACGMQVIMTSAQDHDQPPFLQKSFPRDQVKQLEAETSGGNIIVAGEATGDARVEVYVRSNNGGGYLSKEEAQQRMDEQVDLTVAIEGGTLKAIAKRKGQDNDNWRRSVSVSFRIYVPETVSSELRTSGGNIDLKDLSGTEHFRTSGGNMNLEQLTGKVVGSTSGGNVHISDSKNDIDLHTSGGNMHATHCEGTITLGTSGGNVGLEDVKGTIHATTSGGHIDGEKIDGELEASTSGGNIHLNDLSCSLTASTSGGNIDVDLKTMGKFLDLSNSGGNIAVSLPKGQGMNLSVSGDRVSTVKLENFSGDIDKHSIAGALNGGGIPVKVRGNGGHVELSFR
ncbi:MAG TPA: hypothetical protein VG052_02070 [Puia sp.]|jgi:hypothetical protein|nr:hypothetical protein [Puia sp.]